MTESSIKELYQSLVECPPKDPEKEDWRLDNLRSRLIAGETTENFIRDAVIVSEYGVYPRYESLMQSAYNKLRSHPNELAVYIERGWANTDWHLDPPPCYFYEDTHVWRTAEPYMLLRAPKGYILNGHNFGFWAKTSNGCFEDQGGGFSHFFDRSEVWLNPRALDLTLEQPPQELAKDHEEEIVHVGEPYAELFIGDEEVNQWAEQNNKQSTVEEAKLAIQFPYVSFSKGAVIVSVSQMLANPK